MFLNWTPQLKTDAGDPPAEGICDLAVPAAPLLAPPVPAPRAIMPWPWTMRAARLRVGINGLIPPVVFTLQLLVNGLPSGAARGIVGADGVGSFDVLGLPLSGAAFDRLSWRYDIGAGAGTIDVWNVCGVFERIGSTRPTHGLLSWQIAGGGAGDEVRGLYTISNPIPGTDARYTSLAMPLPGRFHRSVLAVVSNTTDVATLLGAEYNDVLGAASAFVLPPSFVGNMFSDELNPPISFDFVAGERFGFGFDGTPATVGGVGGSCGLEVFFP